MSQRGASVLLLLGVLLPAYGQTPTPVTGCGCFSGTADNNGNYVCVDRQASQICTFDPSGNLKDKFSVASTPSPQAIVPNGMCDCYVYNGGVACVNTTTHATCSSFAFPAAHADACSDPQSFCSIAARGGTVCATEAKYNNLLLIRPDKTTAEVTIPPLGIGEVGGKAASFVPSLVAVGDDGFYVPEGKLFFFLDFLGASLQSYNFSSSEAGVLGATSGADGYMYFAGSANVYQVQPRTHTIKAFPIPGDASATPFFLAALDDERFALTYPTLSSLRLIDLAAGSHINIPLVPLGIEAFPTALQTGPDNKIPIFVTFLNPAGEQIERLGVPYQATQPANADMGVTKDFIRYTSATGKNYQTLFRIFVRNHGGTADQFTVNDTLPDSVMFLGFAAGTDPSLACSHNGNAITCKSITPLEPGAQRIIFISVLAKKKEVVINTADVSCASDVNPANDESIVTVEIDPLDLSYMHRRAVAPPHP